LSKFHTDRSEDEQFNDEKWTDRWVVPTEWRSAAEMGEWKTRNTTKFLTSVDSHVNCEDQNIF